MPINRKYESACQTDSTDSGRVFSTDEKPNSMEVVKNFGFVNTQNVIASFCLIICIAHSICRNHVGDR